MRNLCAILDELYKIFDELNIAKFDSRLETPLIAILSDHKGKKYAHFTPTKTWDDAGIEKHEIAMMAEYINRPFTEICSTMLHEMCHLDNYVKEIEDTSNNNAYHNKKFKESAESLGFEVEKDSGGKGWAITIARPELISLFESLAVNKDVFVSFRKLFREDKVAVDAWKYICPNCGIKFTLTKELDLKCKNCNVELARTKKE